MKKKGNKKTRGALLRYSGECLDLLGANHSSGSIASFELVEVRRYCRSNMISWEGCDFFSFCWD